jgi:hypothetical protein
MVEMSVQISIDYWECHLQGEKGEQLDRTKMMWQFFLLVVHVN